MPCVPITMNNMLDVAGLVERIRFADDAGHVDRASQARAELRAMTAAMRAAAAKPPDFTPYRTSTPVSSPAPLLIVVEPDRTVFRALVDAEGLSSRRVRRVSTHSEAIPIEIDAQLVGRQTMVVSREGRG